jgi:hypothetical protein
MGRFAMAVKTATFAVGASAAVACADAPSGRNTGDVKSAAPVSMDKPLVSGLFRADAGPIDRLNFYDARHYVLWRADCSGAGCVRGGTFQIDGEARRITLRDDADGAEIALDYSATDVAKAGPMVQAGAVRQQDLTTGQSAQLVTASECALVDTLRSPDGLLSRSDGGTKAFQDAMYSQIALGGGAVTNPPAWLTATASQARTNCGSRLDPNRGPSLLTWNGLELYDVPSCSSTSGAVPGHIIYSADGDAVMTSRFVPESDDDNAHWSTQQIVAPGDLAKAAANTCKVLFPATATAPPAP